MSAHEEIFREDSFFAEQSLSDLRISQSGDLKCKTATRGREVPNVLPDGVFT